MTEPVPELVVRQSARRQAVLEMLAELPDEPFSMVVEGHCMEPVIESGDRVLIERRSRYAPGDVVVFLSTDDRFLVHRVLGARRRDGQWQIITGADDSEGYDDPVRLDRVVGAVIGFQDGREFAIEPRSRVRSASRYLRLAFRGIGRQVSRLARTQSSDHDLEVDE